MKKNVYDEPIRRRGICLTWFVVESVTLDEDSEKKINNYELSANAAMQQGTLAGAYANAVVDAANNANGAANGFMGVGMMNMASGGVMGGVATNAQPAQQNQAQAGSKFCSNCGSPVSGAFCSNCGNKVA